MKIAAFDLDDLLVDTQARKEAYRSDLSNAIDKDSIIQFYEEGNYLHLDTPKKLAVECVYWMLANGYHVVYVTGRRITAIENTLKTMTNLGFPVNKSMLHLKPSKQIATEAHKKWVFETLIGVGADVEFFFDDKLSNLEVGKDIGIPNLFLSLTEFHTEYIQNPNH